MSNTTLHYGLREALKHLKDEGRLAVLISYVLHANIRNRAWPSINTLIDETGFGKTTVIAAKEWLVEHGALERVTVELRAGADEQRLHHRCDVMQVTGWLNIDEKDYQILYFNAPAPADFNGSPDEPKKKVEAEPPAFYGSPSERSFGEQEVTSEVIPTDSEDEDLLISSSSYFSSSEGQAVNQSPEIVHGVTIPERYRTSNAFEVWSEVFPGSPLTQLIGDELGDWIDDIGDRAVVAAIITAGLNNARSPMKYIDTVLLGWQQEAQPGGMDLARWQQAGADWSEIES